MFHSKTCLNKTPLDITRIRQVFGLNRLEFTKISNIRINKNIDMIDIILKNVHQERLKSID